MSVFAFKLLKSYIFVYYECTRTFPILLFLGRFLHLKLINSRIGHVCLKKLLQIL